MTEATELESRVAELFVDGLQLEVPSPDLDLFQSGAVDSLMFVKLLALLEERFRIRLSFDELEIDDFRTLRRIACFVARKRAAERQQAYAAR